MQTIPTNIVEILSPKSKTSPNTTTGNPLPVSPCKEHGRSQFTLQTKILQSQVGSSNCNMGSIPDHLLKACELKGHYMNVLTNEELLAQMTTSIRGQKCDNTQDDQIGSNISAISEFFSTHVTPSLVNPVNCFIEPKTHFYAFGPRGVGVRTAIEKECRDLAKKSHKISIIQVLSTTRVPGMMEYTYHLANELAPCIVLFDNATSLFCESITPAISPNHVFDTRYFAEWWSVSQNKKFSDFNKNMVWTVVSGRGSPDTLQPSYKELITNKGIVGFIGSPDRASRMKYFFSFIGSVFSSHTFPDTNDRIWQNIAGLFADISEACTYREMRTYMNNVLHKFIVSNSTRSVSSSITKVPDVDFFRQEFNQTRIIDTQGKGNVRTICQNMRIDPLKRQQHYQIVYQTYLVTHGKIPANSSNTIAVPSGIDQYVNPTSPVRESSVRTDIQYSPTHSQIGYSPTSPCYSPSSPGYSPTSPKYLPYNDEDHTTSPNLDLDLDGYVNNDQYLFESTKGLANVGVHGSNASHAESIRSMSKNLIQSKKPARNNSMQRNANSGSRFQNSASKSVSSTQNRHAQKRTRATNTKINHRNNKKQCRHPGKKTKRGPHNPLMAFFKK